MLGLFFERLFFLLPFLFGAALVFVDVLDFVIRFLTQAGFFRPLSPLEFGFGFLDFMPTGMANLQGRQLFLAFLANRGLHEFSLPLPLCVDFGLTLAIPAFLVSPLLIETGEAFAIKVLRGMMIRIGLGISVVAAIAAGIPRTTASLGTTI